MKKNTTHPSPKSRALTVYTPRQPLYPNAADRSYFVTKAVNAVTAVVSTLGFVTAMLFLVTLS